MSRILVPSAGPESWQALLAKPELHWATGYSARTVAHSWEAAAGLPPEVGALLTPVFGPVDLLFAIPERKTPLPGGRRESQSDVFALVRHAEGLVACTIEGKVDEPFGPTVAEFRVGMSPGKAERIDYLCKLLGIDECPGEIQYQLLHRTASALIEAERFFAHDAAMIVHSFSPEMRWFEAFRGFCGLLGHDAEPGKPTLVTVPSGKRLLLGWACGDQRFRSA